MIYYLLFSYLSNLVAPRLLTIDVTTIMAMTPKTAKTIVPMVTSDNPVPKFKAQNNKLLTSVGIFYRENDAKNDKRWLQLVF